MLQDAPNPQSSENTSEQINHQSGLNSPKPKIRLLLVLPFFYPHRGGSQKYAEEIYAKIIQKHSNFNVDVLCYDTDDTKKYFENYRGMNIYRIPCWNLVPARFALPKPFALLKMLSKLKQNHYTHVNTHIRFFDPAWWLWAYAASIGAKSIYTEHIPSHPEHDKWLIKNVALLVDLTLAKFALNQYTYLTSVNEASSIYLYNFYHITQPVYLIRIGTDTEFFKPNKMQANFELKSATGKAVTIDKNTILITYLGRIIETKGVRMLTEIATQMVRERRNIVFAIAGPGELQEELTAAVERAALSNSIVLTGNLDYQQSAELLARTNIFVNPSHHNEGLPTTIIEAGSAECCVIATDNGGTKELVQNEVTGYLIKQRATAELKQALNNAIEHPEKRLTLGKALRRKVLEEYNWDKNSEDMYKLITAPKSLR
jgi:glycosyltransferase involved in cell wall biosynthesis